MIELLILLTLLTLLVYFTLRYIRDVPPVGKNAWDKLPIDFKREVHASGLRFSDFTCSTCNLAETCRSRFDFYNVDGDCLEDR